MKVWWAKPVQSWNPLWGIWLKKARSEGIFFELAVRVPDEDVPVNLIHSCRRFQSRLKKAVVSVEIQA